MKSLTVLYRGALETCNYACGYCPFAKRKETKEKKAQDIEGLNRFIAWVAEQTDISFNLFFTPWGEALVFKRYQQALKTLTELSHVNKIVFQTNLSVKLDFLTGINHRKLRLWCTYHPTEVARERFINKTKALDLYGVKHSVGVVGKPSLFNEIEMLRKELNPETYLWINAYVKAGKHFPYTEQQSAFLTAIDPLFHLNKVYPSKGLECFAGENAITVDEFGDIRRCHFIDQVIGNIEQLDWSKALQSKNCSRAFCDCHIGYIYLKPLALDKYFGDQLIERIALIK